jgi:hypothetical protein
MSEGSWNNADIVVVIQTVFFAEIMLDRECKGAACHSQASQNQQRKITLTEKGGSLPSFYDVAVEE